MLVMTGNQIIPRTALALVKKFNDIVDNNKDFKRFYYKIISPNMANPLSAYAIEFIGGVGNIKKMS